LSFVNQHWRRQAAHQQPFLLGAHHSTVGCCWAIMRLMFVAGTGSVGRMLLLGAGANRMHSGPRCSRGSRASGALRDSAAARSPAKDAEQRCIADLDVRFANPASKMGPPCSSLLPGVGRIPSKPLRFAGF
jgi:hypothetical protein